MDETGACSMTFGWKPEESRLLGKPRHK